MTWSPALKSVLFVDYTPLDKGFVLTRFEESFSWALVERIGIISPFQATKAMSAIANGQHQLLLFPAAIAAASVVARVDVVKLLQPSWPRGAGAWARVIAALFIGVLTHIAWDGATRASWWPASVLFESPAATRAAWALSTVVGSGLVIGFVYIHFRSNRWFEVRARGWRIIATVALTAIASFVVGLGVLAPDPVVPRWPAEILAIRAAVLTVFAWTLSSRGPKALGGAPHSGA